MDPEAGFLLYLKTGNMFPVPGNRMDRRGNSCAWKNNVIFKNCFSMKLSRRQLTSDFKISVQYKIPSDPTIHGPDIHGFDSLRMPAASGAYHSEGLVP